MILPGPHPLRILRDFLFMQFATAAEETKTCRSRAGRLSRPACAPAHRKKAGDFPKNKKACFLGNPQPFLLPRSSPGILKSSRRILSVIPSAQHRQGENQDPAGPDSGVRGLKKSPRFCCLEFSCRNRKFQAHTVCFFKCAASPRRGPGPGGSWFGGSGAEEAPDVLSKKPVRCGQTSAGRNRPRRGSIPSDSSRRY